MEISIGNLTDQLTIVNIRIWMLEDQCRNTCDLEEVGRLKLKINDCNQLRNNLIEAIDKFHGLKSIQGSTKIYGKQ